MDVWTGIANGNEGFWNPVTTSKEKSVGRTTRRGAIGWNGNKAIIAVRPATDASRMVETMKNLGCDGKGICLDSGTPQTFKINNQMIFEGNETLQGIIHI